jgi:hypothetical protein
MHHSFKFVRKFKLRLPNHMLYEYGSFCQRIKFFSLFYNFARIQRCLFKTIPLFTLNLNVRVAPQLDKLLAPKIREYLARTHSALRRAVIDGRRRSAVSRVQRRRRAAEYWIITISRGLLPRLTALRSATPLSKSKIVRLLRAA